MIRKIILMLVWMTFLTGFAYPMLVTGIAFFTMKEKAQGSLIIVDGRAIGSRLIAQKFESEQYFWPRPSAGNYNPLSSGGSNLGPTSLKLKQLVQERKEKISQNHDVSNGVTIPSDLLYASGSGLDPHISVKAAHFQLERIAKARQMDEQKKINFYYQILKISRARPFFFLGTPCVNVLELNRALDELKQAS